jgi:hypothetical protein
MTVLALALAFIAVVTWASYTLGKTKTENARVAGIIGFMLCLFPPFALIYLVVLLVKPEIDVV